jgi:hypothetical protein
VKQFTFISKIEGVSGQAIINIPVYKERIAQTMNVHYQIIDGKMVDSNQLQVLAGIISAAEKYIVSVDLKTDSAEYKSIDDLQYDKVGGKILQEIGETVLFGLDLGKS